MKIAMKTRGQGTVTGTAAEQTHSNHGVCLAIRWGKSIAKWPVSTICCHALTQMSINQETQMHEKASQRAAVGEKDTCSSLSLFVL